MTKRTARWLMGMLVLLVLPIALVNMPSFGDCAANSPLSDHRVWFPATEIVVQPWRGPHHVYGIFTIPKRYKFHHLYTATLTIRGVAAELEAGSLEDKDAIEGAVENGHYTKRVYVSTRTALWYLLTGRFGDVKTSCHWWLVISDRGR